MKNEQNALMGDSMSKNQNSPGNCDPRDWTVMEADESSAPAPFHGQCGTTKAEYNKLLQEGEARANASNFTECEVHPDVNNANNNFAKARQ